MTKEATIRRRVLSFAAKEADAVFAVWDAGGDFMARRAKATAAIDSLAAKLCVGEFEHLLPRMQAVGYLTGYCERYSKHLERWDGTLALEAAAIERAAAIRRRRIHHVRMVFR